MGMWITKYGLVQNTVSVISKYDFGHKWNTKYGTSELQTTIWTISGIRNPRKAYILIHRPHKSSPVLEKMNLANTGIPDHITIFGLSLVSGLNADLDF